MGRLHSGIVIKFIYLKQWGNNINASFCPLDAIAFDEYILGMSKIILGHSYVLCYNSIGGKNEKYIFVYRKWRINNK